MDYADYNETDDWLHLQVIGDVQEGKSRAEIIQSAMGSDEEYQHTYERQLELHTVMQVVDSWINYHTDHNL